MKSTLAVVSVAVAALVAAACGSDSATAPKPAKGPDAQCVIGALAVGQTVQGDLSVATSCAYPLVWDSTDTSLGQSYNFSVQSGKGYLVSLLATWDNDVQLIGGTTASPLSLAWADYSAPYQSTLPFIATSTTTYSVRVGSDDNSPAGDTGAYTLRAQSCKVPLPTITDSVSYTGALGSSDCTAPLSDFISHDSSHVHLYAVHFGAGASRTIYFGVPGASLAFDFGGAGYDPYYYLNGTTWGHQTNITDGYSYTFTAGDSGVYTMVVGTNAYSASSQPYTITFGAEVPAASRVTPPPSSGSAISGRARALQGRKRGH